ncbi:GAF domain-containing protein [Heliobacterium gestii]|uniref:histidine kinase n=1 Tax=Heliomicrobium gestii TaxID=2699 RepID=A0A845LBB8_HELGE|nr:sensor histidine kinase [Heliomicrobium gestii]MBM7866079.1 two-component system sensor histidine kinase LytS [Heliomicrobium gestii]MZP42594.1 GAF domain-containing protein [Heliomicrobium gestii]
MLIHPDILLFLTQRMTIVITISFLLSRQPAVRRFFANGTTTREDVYRLIVIFGGLSIIGTYAAIPIDGALANSRVIGPVLAGLLGGPLAGFGAGLIGGVHRFAMGGFTALACAISTIAEGLLAGLIRRYHPEALNGMGALITGLMAETLQMLIILAVARPFEDAVLLVSHIALPMITVNAVGIAVSVMLIQDIRAQEEQAGALEAQKSLRIANITLPLLRRGLNESSAQAVAQVVKEMTDLDAVALTDREKILAHVGLGADHHLAGQPFLTRATEEALQTGGPVIASSQDEIQCAHLDCPLHAAVIVPLVSKDMPLGTLKLYRTKEVGIVDEELAKGLAHLFSTQLEIAELEQQARLAATAEIRALQAQINPHFLFNALNTVASYVRTHPETARNLLIQLGDFFRKNLREPSQFVSLREELAHIESYLALEQARFEDRLQVIHDIDPGALSCPIPPLLLQPLVENALRHGLLPLRDGGSVTIRARRQADDHIDISVEDDGVGMTPEKVAQLLVRNGATAGAASGGIGLRNVHERLCSIYGPDYGLRIESKPGLGTICALRIPDKDISLLMAS